MVAELWSSAKEAIEPLVPLESRMPIEQLEAIHRPESIELQNIQDAIDPEEPTAGDPNISLDDINFSDAEFDAIISDFASNIGNLECGKN